MVCILTIEKFVAVNWFALPQQNCAHLAQFALHFIASPHATETVDALTEIRSHVRVAQVFGIV